MKTSYYLFVLFLSFSVNAQKNIHATWNQMLQTYVSEEGNVNYKDWQTQKSKLDTYITVLESMPPKEHWSKNQTLAYWINAYNALTVQLILNHYPLKSIKDIKDPWDTKCFTAGEKSYTLGDIEHKILRKMDEPRIHFAINCASVSCPKLLNESYQEKTMEEQLSKASKEFLCDTSKNILAPDHIELSKIFSWFGSDFGNKSERLNFIRTNSGKEINTPKISYLPYDWNLNE
ncbi:DUF547 domain-containing protein [Flavobacteriaceae bacterium]|jgi:hypothetical protein|nr:DUF547 domain-containing protein [Flavobacteriaceae bacterium]MDA7710927.1 DUF547 domain-containing protein [Flavobacteriaceae bacterium]MDA8993495.1 DUF547 domain-containing protein [Flavobacteriaceae bacterium]MDB4306591.1 DUF547 domain-containing protein [Flavobacteriaceae bacterium]